MAQTGEVPAGNIPEISGMMLRGFRGTVRGYFRRHFRAVSVQISATQRQWLAQAGAPLIVYANHSSWWDPMVSVLLAERLLPQRKHYAPMDAAALARYPVLRKMGIFPVEMQTARGAAQFLRTSQAVLASGGVVWITPQGRFADTREPLAFKPGLGALAARVPGVTLLPLAIEYTFWDERLPEVLLRFGEAMTVPDGVSADAATELATLALAKTMAELKTGAMARDAGAFETLLEGGRGAGGFYGLGRRARALLGGKHVALDHTPRKGNARGEDVQE